MDGVDLAHYQMVELAYPSLYTLHGRVQEAEQKGRPYLPILFNLQFPLDPARIRNAQRHVQQSW